MPEIIDVQGVVTVSTTVRQRCRHPLSQEPRILGEDTEVRAARFPGPTAGCRGCLMAVGEQPFAPGAGYVPYLGPWGRGGKRAGGHPLGITWRWDSVGAGGEGQLASAAWSRPDWLGSPRWWGSG